MSDIDCAIFAEATKESITKVRRWTRESLPADPETSLRRGGFTRKFSRFDAFQVFIYGKFFMARAAIDKMAVRGLMFATRDWIRKNIFHPMENQSNEPPYYWELYCWYAGNDKFHVEARGTYKAEVYRDYKGKETNDPLCTGKFPTGVKMPFTIEGEMEILKGDGLVQSISWAKSLGRLAGTADIILPISQLAEEYKKLAL